MLARLRSWWKNTSKTLDAVVILMLVILIALVVVIVLGYTNNWSWAGLHGKTLYDWLQLLIIPAVLAVGGYLFNYSTSRNEQTIASDNQREAAMKEYFDNMSELLLHEKLRQSGEDDEVRKIARVRTLTVLPRLDGVRKRNVLLFIYESGLIDKSNRIVDMDGADLSGVDLYGINLQSACLKGANLKEAFLETTNLGGADLEAANLSGANLELADLFGANLSGVDLSGANLRHAMVEDEEFTNGTLTDAIMPDGTKHA